MPYTEDMTNTESSETVASVQYVTKGAGTAVHIAYVYPGGSLATLCDKWGSSGAYGSRIKPSTADAPTCKSCIRNAAAVTA